MKKIKLIHQFETSNIIFVLLLLSVVSLSSLCFAQQPIYKMTQSLSMPRQMYGTAVLGDYLYVIGGNIQGKGDSEEGYVTTVEKALINPDGTIGKWTQTTPLSKKRSYIHNSTLVLNDIVYVVMGTEGAAGIAAKTILWTRPKPNGDLEPWRESIACPGPGLKLMTAVSTPGYLHVLGGRDSNNQIYQDVWSAKLAPDGSIISWEKGNSLPVPLFFQCAAVSGGKVWVWGGAMNGTLVLNNKVFMAPILASGKIGQWVFSGSTLPMPFYSAAVAVSGDYLITFCPRYESRNFTSDIWYAQVKPTGLSDWIKMPSNLPAKLYIGVATDYRKGNLYIPGGRINQDEDEKSLIANVFYLKLASKQQTDVKTDSTFTANTFDVKSAQEKLSYIQQNSAGTTFRGFMPYEQGRQTAQIQMKPMVVYFYNDKATKCKEQSQLLQSFNTQSYSNNIIFSEANAAFFPQLSQQYGVFRIPCWIFFDKTGKETMRETGVLQQNQIENYLTRILSN